MSNRKSRHRRIAMRGWWRPQSLGYPAATASLSLAAAPLLAGFSITLVGVIAQAPQSFLAPGVAILLLALAAIMFVLCVQCGYWSQFHLVKPADVAAWDVAVDENAQREQVENSLIYAAWAHRATRFYEAGVLVLISGFGAAIPPTAADSAANAVLRWLAFGLVVATLLFAVFWIAGPEWAGAVPLLRRSELLRRATEAWFYPARNAAVPGREESESDDGR